MATTIICAINLLAAIINGLCGIIETIYYLEDGFIGRALFRLAIGLAHVIVAAYCFHYVYVGV